MPALSNRRSPSAWSFKEQRQLSSQTARGFWLGRSFSGAMSISAHHSFCTEIAQGGFIAGSELLTSTKLVSAKRLPGLAMLRAS